MSDDSIFRLDAVVMADAIERTIDYAGGDAEAVRKALDAALEDPDIDFELFSRLWEDYCIRVATQAADRSSG